MEVRFYPRTKAVPTFVVVGKVICDEKRATIASELRRTREVRPFDSVELLAKLEFLVASASPEPAPELLGLRSQFWSFVEVGGATAGPHSLPEGSA